MGERLEVQMREETERLKAKAEEKSDEEEPKLELMKPGSDSGGECQSEVGGLKVQMEQLKPGFDLELRAETEKVREEQEEQEQVTSPPLVASTHSCCCSSAVEGGGTPLHEAGLRGEAGETEGRTLDGAEPRPEEMQERGGSGWLEARSTQAAADPPTDPCPCRSRGSACCLPCRRRRSVFRRRRSVWRPHTPNIWRRFVWALRSRNSSCSWSTRGR